MTDEEINRRDALAFRAMTGETLTRDEAADLADLNARLATWLPKPAPLPDDVRDALDSVHGILAPMRYPKDLARALAGFLDQLARSVEAAEPELATACLAASAALKRYAGPDGPPPPPPA